MGDTAGDSHTGAAADGSDERGDGSRGILPFQSGIEAGADMIMVGAYHSTEPDRWRFASCEHFRKDHCGSAAQRIGLSGDYYYRCKNMGAITEYYKSDVAAIMALKAGADMVLMPENFEEAYQGVLDAVADGTVSEERIDDSLRRIYRVKLRSRVL